MNIVGIGTEIVECLRIARMIERHGESFLRRVFTAAEIEYCNSRREATRHFAAGWAAKEALLRALGSDWSRDLQWPEIEVRHDGSKAEFALSGELEATCRRLGVRETRLALASCRTHATAFVVALG